MLVHQFPTSAQPSRVVILGAAGFVGAAVARALKVHGVDTLVLARRELDLLAAGAGEKLGALLRSDDVLIFVSARAPVKNSATLLENLRMAEAVCVALGKNPPAHLVYVSSDAVYKDSSGALDESSCAEPGSLHGIMHLTREVMLRSLYSGPFAIIRPTLIYGLQDPHNGYGPNRFRRLAAEGREIVLFGEGEERRDHVSIKDVADLLVRLVMRRSVGVLNAVSGQTVSFRETAEFINAQFGNRSTVIGSPRVGAMPHNGYRPFDAAGIRTAFPDFISTPWQTGLAALCHEAQSPNQGS